MTLGVGPLLLANVHWLDKPDDKSVAVGNARGTDELYPGFTGRDVTIGLTLDLRFWHLIGLELDLFRQNDRGSGNITLKDTGNLCFLPSVTIPYSQESHRVTLGQHAWHVPLLLKLTIPGRKVVVQDEDGNVDIEREIRKWFTTFAIGPEFVFPGNATLEGSPAGGLDYPEGATVSDYVMYTGAFGFERRVSDRHDVRLLFSVRGSYNPGPGEAALKRGEYALRGGRIVPIIYRSEWRSQAALTFGVGWFF